MPTAQAQAETRIVAEIVAKPGKSDALRAALLAMIPPSVAEPGCLLYELHEATEEPDHFFFYERYVDAAAFESHLGTPHFRQLGPTIADLIAAPPRITRLRVIG